MLSKEQRTLNRRIESASWALFLIFVGLMLLIDEARVPKGAWMIGIGGILLALNVMRVIQTLPLSSFSTGVGVFLVILGTADYASYSLDKGPLVLLLVGIFLRGRVLKGDTRKEG
jgi:hypothetical protein